MSATKLAGKETQTWKIGVLSAKLKGNQVEQKVLQTIVKEANEATRRISLSAPLAAPRHRSDHNT
jgi:hypothetical protein